MAETEDKKSPWEAYDWTLPDGTLSAVVDAVNALPDPDAGWAITLLVDGTVLSGTLIPSWRWFELQAGDESISRGSKEDFFRDVSADHLAAAKTARECRDLAEEEWTEEHRGANDAFSVHIHLKDARLLLGAGMNMPKVLWRVRLARVSAWHFGVLSTEDPE